MLKKKYVFASEPFKAAIGNYSGESWTQLFGIYISMVFINEKV